MQVKYIGPKTKISISLPVGLKHKSALIGHLDFFPGKPVEMEQADAEKLLELDSNFASVASIDPEPVKPKRGRPFKKKEELDGDSDN